jgi:hypothetical protein
MHRGGQPDPDDQAVRAIGFTVHAALRECQK